jgi:thioesterase domain-containing protein
MPGIGNEMWTFLELVKNVVADQPVYGVLPSERATDRSATLTETAARYVADIEAFLPDGPFALGGYCSGAVTAFEVARQLRARGRRVPMLVVFDYWLEETSIDVIPFLTNAATWVADDLLRTSVSNHIGRARSKLRLARTRLLRAVGATAAPDDLRDILGLWRYADHEAQRLRRDIDAIDAYRFSEYDGPIHVFRARTRALTTGRHPTKDLGWRRVAAGSLTIETVPGSHDSMFGRPHVVTLAERLEAVLQSTFRDADQRSREAGAGKGVGE